MKKIILLPLIAVSLLLGGCADKAEKKAKPTFMFWCFRKEIVSTNYHVENMTSMADAGKIKTKLKRLPGYIDLSTDLSTQTATVHYQSSTIRKMNIEEAIAQAGFTTNKRPGEK